MTPHRQITIWENRRRQRALYRFLSLALARRDEFEFRSPEPDEIPLKLDMDQINTEINKTCYPVAAIIHGAGVWPAYLTPRPAAECIQRLVQVIVQDLPKHDLNLSAPSSFNLIQRAIGVYEADERRAWLRTLNPLYWLGRLLDGIASAPFHFLGRLGFDQARIEASTVGRVFKGLIQVLVAIAALLTILERFGLAPFGMVSR